MISRPSRSVPLRSSIACAAPSGESKRTMPNPRERPSSLVLTSARQPPHWLLRRSITAMQRPGKTAARGCVGGAAIRATRRDHMWSLSVFHVVSQERLPTYTVQSSGSCAP